MTYCELYAVLLATFGITGCCARSTTSQAGPASSQPSGPSSQAGPFIHPVKRTVQSSWLGVQPAKRAVQSRRPGVPQADDPDWLHILLAHKANPNQTRQTFVFKRLISTYDFGEVTIGQTRFCNNGDYLSCLIKRNSESEYPWWGAGVGSRPSSVLMIANAELWAVLLDAGTGSVIAFPHGALWHQAGRVVASDFELFVRGVGTVYLARATTKDKKGLAQTVAEEAGGLQGPEFWEMLAV